MNVVGNVSGQSPIINPWASEDVSATPLGSGQFRGLATRIQQFLRENPNLTVEIGAYQVSMVGGRLVLRNMEASEAPATFCDALEATFAGVNGGEGVEGRLVMEALSREGAAADGQTTTINLRETPEGRGILSRYVSRWHRFQTLAHRERNAGNLPRAIELFERGLAIASGERGQALSFLDLAECYLEAGDRERATEMFARAYQADATILNVEISTRNQIDSIEQRLGIATLARSGSRVFLGFEDGRPLYALDDAPQEPDSWSAMVAQVEQ